MSNFNRKGYTSMPVRIKESGEMKWVPVKIGSRLHKKHMKAVREYHKSVKAEKTFQRRVAKELVA